MVVEEKEMQARGADTMRETAEQEKGPITFSLFPDHHHHARPKAFKLTDSTFKVLDKRIRSLPHSHTPHNSPSHAGV